MSTTYDPVRRGWLFTHDGLVEFVSEARVARYGGPNWREVAAMDKAHEFIVKDSGKRQSFDSGMVRDTTEGKVEYHRVADGPMLKRWAIHLTKGKQKYEDVAPGVPNWTLASGEEEYQRFRQSAFRHFLQWYNGELDEDHASACFFNINGAESVKLKAQ